MAKADKQVLEKFLEHFLTTVDCFLTIRCHKHLKMKLCEVHDENLYWIRSWLCGMMFKDDIEVESWVQEALI